MWRYLAGGFALLLLVAAGVVMFRTPARSVAVLRAAPGLAATAVAQDAPLPDTIPEATDKTREQKRFDRYDKDRNTLITREEYLAARRKAFAKLDLDKDGKLSFDEWAAKTTEKFATADGDKSGTMNPREFASTAPKTRAPVRAKCPPVAARPKDEEEG